MSNADIGQVLNFLLADSVANKNATLGLIGFLKNLPQFDIEEYRNYLTEVRNAEITGVDNETYKQSMDLYLRATENTGA